MTANAIRCALVLLTCVLASLVGQVEAQQSSAPTIEKLLTDGWEIAGYIAVADNRSLILFKHKSNTYLVQCSVLVDITRNPRVVTYCYELK